MAEFEDAGALPRSLQATDYARHFAQSEMQETGLQQLAMA